MEPPVLWLRYLPAFFRKKIEHRPNLLKILNNTGWLFFDKILRMFLGLLVGVWVARYLGPEQFGVFNYAAAIVSLFTAVATLGLNNIVVRDLVRNQEDSPQTLGTGFVLQIIGGLAAYFMAVALVAIIRPDNKIAIAAVAILGLGAIFKSTDVIKYWYESKVQSKYVVWVESSIFLFSLTIKVVLIISEAPLLAFVFIALIESVLIALVLIKVYTSQGFSLRDWVFDYKRAKCLLLDSWPLILSGLAAMIYMRIDQIMLGKLIGDEAVGVYSAALRISELWYFIPISIVGSVFPAIIEAKSANLTIYRQRMESLLTLMVGLALAIALPVTLLAPWLINLLYGAEYSNSSQILVIHVWSGLFVFLGVASARWFIAENLQRFTFYRTLAGCIVSVALNFLLIPAYGPTGAAVASVVAQAVASVFFNSINSKTRPLFVMQMKAMVGFNIWNRTPL